MKRILRRCFLWAPLGGLLLVTLAPSKEPTMPPVKPAKAVDVGKRVIEAPVENILADVPGALNRIAAAAENTKAETAAAEKAQVDAQNDEANQDRRKFTIEQPVKYLVSETTPSETIAIPDPAPSDKFKEVIETPTKAVLKQETTTAPKTVVSHPQLQERVTKSDPPVENPRVEPGKVSWHADFEAARRASGESGKPVMLFQLMGRLDQRFT